MRIFAWACLFGVLVASVGCMTNNWQNSKLLNPEPAETEPNDSAEEDEERRFFFQTFGQASGVDPKAREIEKRLGY